MTWGSDITLYNTAINSLGAYVIAREGNIPVEKIKLLKKTAQADIAALVVPLSATITLPKDNPSG